MSRLPESEADMAYVAAAPDLDRTDDSGEGIAIRRDDADIVIACWAEGGHCRFSLRLTPDDLIAAGIV